MGWWKCNDHGGIDWSNKPTGHPGTTGLINAIPDRDSTEDYYNGDAPADAMYVPIAILKSWFQGREPKPTKNQLMDLFIEKKVDPIFKHIEKKKLDELIDITWKEIDEIYKEAWGRPAYPEERVFCCSFSFGGADGYADRRQYDGSVNKGAKQKKERKEWWELRKLEHDYIKNYEQGKWPYWWHVE